MLLKIAGLLFIVVSGTFGQVVSNGSCPNVRVQKNFQLKSYLGKWYSYQQYPACFSDGGSCVTAQYGLNPNGTLSVLNSQLSKNGQYFSITGFASLVAPGKLFVEFPGIRPRGLKEDGNYWVLSTDYSNYSVVYFCSDFMGSRIGGLIIKFD
jgi:lipocalin